MFTLESAPLCGGAQLHLITTANAEFAFALYEIALNVTIEPHFAASDARFTLEFTATNEDLADILAAAQLGIQSAAP